jgi:hypothetical protein
MLLYLQQITVLIHRHRTVLKCLIISHVPLPPLSLPPDFCSAGFTAIRNPFFLPTAETIFQTEEFSSRHFCNIALKWQTTASRAQHACIIVYNQMYYVNAFSKKCAFSSSGRPQPGQNPLCPASAERLPAQFRNCHTFSIPQPC